MYQKKKAMENFLILIIDILAVWISIGIAFGIRYGMLYGRYNHIDQLWQILLISLLYGLINSLTDFNNHFFRRGYFEEFAAVIRNQAIFSVSWVVILFLIHRSSELSRLVFGYFIIINVGLTFAFRTIFKQFMTKVYKASKYSNRLLIVTTSSQIETIIENLVEYNEWNRTLVGIVLTDKSQVGEAVCGLPIVADMDSLLDYVVHHDVDEVFINDSTVVQKDTLQGWITNLEIMGVIVDLNIDIFNIPSSGKKILNRVGKYAVVTFARNIFSTRQIVAKRMLDIAGSLVGMIVLAIATVFVAPAIKLNSSGPVFFGQTRVGKNGRKFTFYKFRSMYQDAEQRKKELMKKNEVKGLMFKMEDDPRITKVGKFLRNTSIDELPQFWNVLRGDMSLVGTRPPTVDEFERYEVKHKCRLSMTPGLTGLWQISGRSNIKDFDEVVKLDMQYIDNWSILKDIKILILTVWVVLTRKGSR
ncbi:exopolysaccharide biosynthesis polyprenyl glycosylphosphotransferase [Lacrimispora sphenoides]|jgi:exopolysaccharide biosynthesis polyprenyl glycosylphosphotransferase|uniref:sugar transferase n=1 Tax=Lacrimispora sphenoides TaxID=29370 RepID=UPI0008BC3ABA|nr:sugar transferase [Lacrimispora sphenoides]SET90900.1 exopolysaccharide biosynthesis polyprenyl glycosylphosphotransferase [Lacrimispora sphenoides]